MGGKRKFGMYGAIKTGIRGAFKARRLYDDYQRYRSSGPSIVDGGGELSRSRAKQGRVQSRYTNKYARHMIRSTVERSIYGFQDWGNYGGTSGAVPLLNYSDTVTPTYTLPVHLYDLTCVPNNVGGTIRTGQIGYQLVASSSTTSGATLTWRALGPAMDAIRSSHASTVSAAYPNGTSLLRAASIKMMLYAPTGIPCKYVINLVQFPDEDFAPQCVLTSGTVANASNYQSPGTILNTLSTTHSSWWLNKMQPFAKNPVVHQFREGAPKMKVIYSKTIIINPKETTEVSNTKYHQFDLYKALNQRCNYNYEADKNINILDDDTEVTEFADNKCSVHPSKRTYLMIRCLGNFGTGAGVFPGMDSNITINSVAAKAYTAFGSYDISLRTYHDDLAA